MRIGLTAISVMLTATSAFAGFNSWTVETEDDPFSGGSRVTVDMSTSLRSGVLIKCYSADHGITVRAVPGFAFDDRMIGLEPDLEFAFDGKRLLGQSGEVGAVGNNIAASEASLSQGDAKTFVDAFIAAKKQVAVKDGISDSPHLLSAKGSAKAGAALLGCLSKQKP